jgi:hypothetical protein
MFVVYFVIWKKSSHGLTEVQAQRDGGKPCKVSWYPGLRFGLRSSQSQDRIITA